MSHADVFSQRRPRAIATAAALATVYALGMLNYLEPAIRFTLPVLNSLAFLAIQLIPIALVLLVVTLRSRWARLLWLLVFIPLAALSGLLGFCATMEASHLTADGQDPGLERLSEVKLKNGQLTIYRTNGGAMTSFGISVRQECQLVQGLLHVRDVWDARPAYEAMAEILSPDLVRFTAFNRFGQDPPKEVALKPLWCPTR